MIEYQNLTNELVFISKKLPQNCGDVSEKISIDNYNSNYQYFLELKCPKDKRYVSKEIVFNGQNGEVILPDTITANTGKVYVQLIIRNKKGIILGKSFISNEPLYNIESSINATFEIDKRTGDYIEFVSKTVEDIKNLSDELENKANSGYFNGEKGERGDDGLNGKDGTIVKIQNKQVDSILFNTDPQMQLNQLNININDIKKNITNINEKFKMDLLFEGQTKSYIINNFDKYDLFLFICSFDGNNTRLSIFADKIGNYFAGAGKSSSDAEVEYGINIVRENNKYSINSAGYFKNNFIWAERIGTSFEYNYNIVSIYGIRCR